MLALWTQYRRTRSIADRDALLAHYSPLADRHAARLSRRFPRQVSFDEVRCAAFDGLLKAIESYDPGRGATFESYCRQHVAGAVLDWLRSIDAMGRTLRSFERRRAKIQEQLADEAGRAATPIEIAERMRLAPRRYFRLLRMAKVAAHVSFSHLEMRSDRDEGSDRHWDVRDSNAEDPSRACDRKLLAEYITRGLNSAERTILVLYYFEDLTMAEIGAVLHLSESRVCQIHKEVLARLRHRSGIRLAEELTGGPLRA